MNQMINRKCLICGKEFKVFPCRLQKKNGGNFCSRHCLHIYSKKVMKGKNMVKKIRKKCQICSKKFSVLPCRKNILKHCSKKCSSKFKSKIFSKQNNPNWKGGVTPTNEKIRKSIEYVLWRNAVYARDNWACQKCNKQGIKLNAHHIKSFAKHPELRFAIDNGKSLCLKCHDKTKKGRGK